jgi:hypothetical protein
MKIPRYSPQGSLTTKAPAAEQSVQTAGMMGGEISKLGGVLNQIGEKFVEIDIATQKNKANVAWASAEQNILTQASQDVNIHDPKVAGEYKKKLEDSYKEVAGSFSIPQAQNEWRSRADLQAIGANTKITEFHYKGKIADFAASTNADLNEMKQSYTETGNP